MTSQTVRLTVAQAVVTYLSRQYSVADGQRRRLIPATLGIFGHGNVAGLGQALDQLSDAMPFIQGRNEQALVHAATAFAKATRRRATLAVTASIGPGALNMVTGAGVATVNRLPVLLLPFMVPPLIGAVQVTSRLLAGRPLSEMLGWLRLLAVYDVVFVTLCTMAFAAVVDE